MTLAADGAGDRLAAEVQRRRAFRAWVRSYHPDVGGDPAAFAAGLQAWRTRDGGPPARGSAAGEVVFFRRRRGLAGWIRRRRDRHARAGQARVI